DFDAKDAAVKAAASKWSSITFGLRAPQSAEAFPRGEGVQGAQQGGRHEQPHADRREHRGERQTGQQGQGRQSGAEGAGELFESDDGGTDGLARDGLDPGPPVS
ncbi:hypothetical protein ACWCQQ_51150, partial [Streptomyces sp. NPDC002143]